MLQLYIIWSTVCSPLCVCVGGAWSGNIWDHKFTHLFSESVLDHTRLFLCYFASCHNKYYLYHYLLTKLLCAGRMLHASLYLPHITHSNINLDTVHNR
jgi:hypothetical protein